MIKALKPVGSLLRPLFSERTWHTMGEYIGLGSSKKTASLCDTASLGQFINSRASHVAQTTLYGYLRTRSGTRFPELFEHPDMLASINIAKWHVWLACLSDLCVFCGQLLRQAGGTQQVVHQQMTQVLSQVLEDTGTPEEAGRDFTRAKEKVIQRINTCDWSIQRDDDTVFSESPVALVYWSPIAHELKQRDEEIVLNSIRFRWIEVRRDTRRLLDVTAFTGHTAAEAKDSD